MLVQFQILDAHACMLYVHELKIKLLKSKFECCPVFQLLQILGVVRIVFTHISPICAWKGKTYRHKLTICNSK